MKTNLDDDRAKSEHVRFLRDFISSHEYLWCSPPRSIPLWLGYKNGAYSVNDRGEPEIRQTSVAAVVDKNIGLAKGY